MCHFSIPGVRAVFAVVADSLPADVRKMRESGIFVPVASLPVNLHIFGVNSFKADEKQGLDDAVELEFSALIRVRDINLAFVVENMHGQRFLIGAKEPPFPKVEMQSLNESGKRLISYKVSWPGMPAPCHFSALSRSKFRFS